MNKRDPVRNRYNIVKKIFDHKKCNKWGIITKDKNSKCDLMAFFSYANISSSVP